MIPLRDVNPARRRAYVTYAFIALNVAAFFLWQPRGAEIPSPGASPAEVRAAVEAIGFPVCRGAIPLELTRFEPLPDLPFDDTRSQEALQNRQLERALCPDKSVLSSLFTSMFLHGGLVHLGGNMLFLWVFGNNVEDRMGHPLFLLFYLVGGVLATYAHVLTDASSAVPLIGASGAISAVLGGYIVMFPRARVLTLVIFYFITMVELPAALILGFWFIIQAFQGAVSLGTAGAGGVAWFAHVGGFLFGVAVAWLFYRRRPERPVPAPPPLEY